MALFSYSPAFVCPAGVLIGAGSFAKVYRARWRQQHVAVKVLHLLGSKAAAKAMAEAAVMIRARHPNVVAAHHVTMWQRARNNSGVTDVITPGCANSFDKISPCSPASFNTTTTNSSSSNAAGSSSSNPFSGTPTCASFNTTANSSSSSGDRSTSIIEGGWGEEELCEHGQGDCEEDVETQAWIVLELCDGTLDTAARSGKLASLVS
jgi:serine/threonine protein kinase